MKNSRNMWFGPLVGRTDKHTKILAEKQIFTKYLLPLWHRIRVIYPEEMAEQYFECLPHWG